MLTYPTTLPLDALETLSSQVMAKSFDKVSFAQALWNLQGFAQSKLIGAETGHIAMGRGPVSDEEALECINELKTPEEEGIKTGIASSLLLHTLLRWALNRLMKEL